MVFLENLKNIAHLRGNYYNALRYRDIYIIKRIQVIVYRFVVFLDSLKSSIKVVFFSDEFMYNESVTSMLGIV